MELPVYDVVGSTDGKVAIAVERPVFSSNKVLHACDERV